MLQMRINLLSQLHKKLYTSSHTHAEPFTSIPGPKDLPVIGNLWRYLPLVGEYKSNNLYQNGQYNLKKYGPLVREQIYRNRCILYVFDPQDIETVFRHDGQFPIRNSHRAMLQYRLSKPEMYSSGGLFAENGAEWFRMRRLFQKPLMDNKVLSGYISQFEDTSEQLIESIRRERDELNEIDNFQDNLFKWGLENLGILILDHYFNSFQKTNNSDIHTLIKAIQDSNVAIMATENDEADMWKLFPTKNYRILCQAQDTISSIIDTLLKSKHDKFESQLSKSSMLRHFFETPGASLNDILLLISDLFLAGIDTTSHALCFTLFFLAKHQDVQEKLRKELNQHLCFKSSTLSLQLLQSMKYLNACVKETLRLEPISFALGRVASKDMIIRDFIVPKGTMIVTQNQIACHQDRYFPKACSYLPERWLESKQKPIRGGDKIQSSSFVCLPFGYGPRSCIGRRFAQMEIYVLLIKIILNFRVEYHYEDLKTIRRLINVIDKAVRLRFIDI